MTPDDPITLDPDPVYTDSYETERERVRDVSGDGLLEVFHVGSTAIPDVPGKPALDVLAVYEDERSMRAAADALADAGHQVESGEDDDAVVAIRWGDDHATFLKLHVRGDERIRNQLLFRDYLRDHPEARREYAEAKREAAEKHPDDVRAYTEAKGTVVGSLLEDAREAGYEDRLPAFA